MTILLSKTSYLWLLRPRIVSYDEFELPVFSSCLPSLVFLEVVATVQSQGWTAKLRTSRKKKDEGSVIFLSRTKNKGINLNRTSRVEADPVLFEFSGRDWPNSKFNPNPNNKVVISVILPASYTCICTSSENKC